MLAAGVPSRVIMEVLGHSGISMTMNTYVHVLPALRQQAADADLPDIMPVEAEPEDLVWTVG
jgi:integrase